MMEAGVLFEELSGEHGDLGVITLNRPDVLNSLNMAMIKAMHTQLQQWAKATHIKAVVVRAVPGRAFCAGGDLRMIYEHRQVPMDASIFFRDEYQLNRFIFHYPKPYIAFLDGVTMGGGVGISIHGSHRVVTENLLFAMPETGIGFFPDVGGSYFLPRLPGHLGFYLGLVGARIGGDDCVFLGIAQEKVPHDALPDLLQALAEADLEQEAGTRVSSVIRQFAVQAGDSRFITQQTVLADCFGFSTMEDIIAALTQAEHEVAYQTLLALQKKSPTSLKVTLRALHMGRQLEFDACMRQEYRLASRFLERHDFMEGIRALIIDKDQQVKWSPDSLEKVTPDEIAAYFAPFTSELS